MTRLLLFAPVLGLWPGTLAAEEDTHPRRIYVTRPAEPACPQIDGRLNDSCWDTVEWGTDFVQWEPAEGEPPTFQTAFKILYDTQYLYIAYRAYDSDPDAIASLLARRDGFPGDWV
jgi:hypothetical protein